MHQDPGGSEATPARPASRRVLVVCDDLMLRTRVAEAAWRAGCECEVAADPESFSNVFEPGASRYRAAIVDLQLAAFPALEAVRRLRSERADLPVIAFGAHVEREALEAARRAGATALPRSQLVRELGSLLARAKHEPLS